MQKLIMLGLLIVVLLAGCKEEERIVDSEVVEQQATVIPVTLVATVMPGCETRLFEKWYEVIRSNSKAFRDESFGYAAMDAESAALNLSRLSDLRDSIYQQPVPECMTELQRRVQLFLDGVSDSFFRYMNGTIGQDILLQEVTTAQAGYDTLIWPEIEAAAATLSERLRNNE